MTPRTLKPETEPAVKEITLARKRQRPLEPEEIEKLRIFMEKYEFATKLGSVMNKTIFYGAIILTGMYTSRDFIGKILTAIKTIFSP